MASRTAWKVCLRHRLDVSAVRTALALGTSTAPLLGPSSYFVGVFAAAAVAAVSILEAEVEVEGLAAVSPRGMLRYPICPHRST